MSANTPTRPEGSKAAHTPGPWTVDGPPHNQIVWSDAENRVCFLAHTNGLDDERDIATGRLIAAAPVMFDAIVRQLENIERWIETGIPADADESKSIYDQLCAARAKASGAPHISPSSTGEKQ